MWKACLQRFRLKGIPLYLKLRYHKTQHLTVPGFSQAITLRPYTKDRPTFEKIFLADEYGFSWPSNLTPPQVIIDAGANIGLSAIYFANKYPSATVLALEPEKENFQLLQKNCSPYPTIKPVQAALWGYSGKVDLEDKGYGEAGYIISEKNGETVAYTVVDLMEAFNLTHVDLLKIDIEGSEKEVFTADTQWLDKVSMVTVETHDRMKPGCEKAVVEAFRRKPFTFSNRGENLIFIHD